MDNEYFLITKMKGIVVSKVVFLVKMDIGSMIVLMLNMKLVIHSFIYFIVSFISALIYMTVNVKPKHSKNEHKTQ